MNTNGHGYGGKALLPLKDETATGQSLPGIRAPGLGPLRASVFIRVHPWFN